MARAKKKTKTKTRLRIKPHTKARGPPMSPTRTPALLIPSGMSAVRRGARPPTPGHPCGLSDRMPLFCSFCKWRHPSQSSVPRLQVSSEGHRPEDPGAPHGFRHERLVPGLYPEVPSSACTGRTLHRPPEKNIVLVPGVTTHSGNPRETPKVTLSRHSSSILPPQRP